MESSNGNENLEKGAAKTVLDAIRQIVRSQRVASRASERSIGLSAAQLLILKRLGDGERLSLNELADQTRTHQSSTSVVVSKLVERGLVMRTRSKLDARRLELALTPSAKKLMRKMPQEAQDRLANALAMMSRNQVKQLAILLQTVVATAGLDAAVEPL